MTKNITFLTGTRADFGKLKSLIKITQRDKNFNVDVIVTGMHLQKEYGNTIDEIHKSKIKNIYSFENHKQPSMDLTLANTIKGVSGHIKSKKPDLLIVHGDRVEALAGAISGTLNNVLTAHIEGGEVSGTVDEIIRHSVTKMSHVHFVANDEARDRLIQLGEMKKSIFTIGSPDLDLMNPKKLPNINYVKKYYDISFDKFAISIFHPVTTELEMLEENIDEYIEALVESRNKFVMIYPNNDLGSNIIIKCLKKLKKNSNFRIFPSLRFEYFLTLLKHSEYIIGNSSAAIREAPFYGIPTINIGTRQNNRSSSNSIINIDCNKTKILNSITKTLKKEIIKNSFNKEFEFGSGNSDKNFLKILNKKSFWKTSHQKFFQDL